MYSPSPETDPDPEASIDELTTSAALLPSDVERHFLGADTGCYFSLPAGTARLVLLGLVPRADEPVSESFIPVGVCQRQELTFVIGYLRFDLSSELPSGLVTSEGGRRLRTEVVGAVLKIDAKGILTIRF